MPVLQECECGEFYWTGEKCKCKTAEVSESGLNDLLNTLRAASDETIKELQNINDWADISESEKLHLAFVKGTNWMMGNIKKRI